MHGQANVSESVLNFGALVKAETAYQFVAQAATAKSFFERARLKVGAIFDGAGLVGIVIEHLLQFFGDEFGFGLCISCLEVAEIGSGGPFGAKGFAEGVGVIFFDGAGGVGGAFCGAVIGVKVNEFGFRENGGGA